MKGIKQRREELGLTQMEVATITGASLQAVRNWDRGTKPTRKFHKALAVALRIPEEEIEVYDE